MKALLSSFACEPNRGSEPGVGWKGGHAIGEHHDVTLVTRTTHQKAIEAVPSSIRFRFYDLPEFISRIEQRFHLIRLHYIFWQLTLPSWLRRQGERYDLIHHLTYNSFQFPGIWWFRREAVVLGPLGGGQTVHPDLLPIFREGSWKERLRSLRVAISPWNPLLRLSLHSADVILVANRDTYARLPEFAKAKARFLLETAITAERTHPLPEPESQELRLLQLGSLFKHKAGELSLRALAHAVSQGCNATLTFVGSGPDEAFLKSYTHELGLEERVRFVRQVAHTEIERLFCDHHAMIFPSIRDTSGNVVLEAMSFGRPVIAIRHQGVIEMATDETAILVDVAPIPEISKAMGEAIIRLASSPQLRQEMGRAGLRRVKESLSWRVYGEKISAAYQEAINRR